LSVVLPPATIESRHEETHVAKNQSGDRSWFSPSRLRRAAG
jgi:hypothetical protein